jgi:hypothetical protein
LVVHSQPIDQCAEHPLPCCHDPFLPELLLLFLHGESDVAAAVVLRMLRRAALLLFRKPCCGCRVACIRTLILLTRLQTRPY